MGYCAMSDAIREYVEYERKVVINPQDIANAIADALGAALGSHFKVQVSIEWRKGENYGQTD